MEPALKQRLLGAAVLVALAVVFLPLLVMDPAPDSGASSVPLRVPPAPDAAGDTRTLDLPLAPAADGAAVLPTPAPAATATPGDASVAPPDTTPATAAGDYAVNFGSYATSADAARVIAALAAAHLPAFQEPTLLGTRTVHRVRIGPYPTSAAAEAARLAAGRVRSDVNARVVVLDAGAAGKSASGATAPGTPSANTPAGTAAAAPVPTPSRTPAPMPTPSAATTAGTTAPTAVTAGADRASPAATTPAKPAPPATAAAPAAANVGYAVQLGAFANADEATRLRDRARAAGFAAFVEKVPTDHGTLNRVRVGPAPDRAAADALRAQVAAKLGVSGIVRPHP